METKLQEVQRVDRSFVSGFMGRPKEFDGGFRQVDWKKATAYIESNANEIESVEVGLAEDFEYTSQLFWDTDGGFETEEGYKFYGCSSWATPALFVNYKNGEEKTLECWEYGENSGFVGKAI